MKKLVQLIGALLLVALVFVSLTYAFSYGPRIKTTWFGGSNTTYKQEARLVAEAGSLVVPPSTIAGIGTMTLRLTDLTQTVHSVRILVGDSLTTMFTDLSTDGPGTVMNRWPWAVQSNCDSTLTTGETCVLVLNQPAFPSNLIEVWAYSDTATLATMEYGLTLHR